MRFTSTTALIETLEGATIVCGDVDDEEGMHLHLADGRVIVIVGEYALSVLRVTRERLH